MKAFFGAVANHNIIQDVNYGVDYHSHLGTTFGNFIFCQSGSLQIISHNISGAPYRNKFSDTLKADAKCALGCIVDNDEEISIEENKDGQFALFTFGTLNNVAELSKKYLDGKGYSNSQLIAKLVSLKENIKLGLMFVRECIKGSLTVWAIHSNGTLYVMRDNVGRIPAFVGYKKDNYCVSLESFVCEKLGYEVVPLKAGEIVEVTPSKYTIVPHTADRLRICPFMWVYYGHAASTFEGVNVEQSRYNGGARLAEYDKDLDIDCVCGIPDSGTAYAIGYANKRRVPIIRPFIKYNATWSRSFIPSVQQERNIIANMKQIMIPSLVKNKSIVVVDDSVVRGTQLKAIIALLRDSGAEQIHLRIACPPMLYNCKYLQSPSLCETNDLLAPKILNKLFFPNGVQVDMWNEYEQNREAYERAFAKMFGVDSVRFQSLDDMIFSIGTRKDFVCTHCWTGIE